MEHDVFFNNKNQQRTNRNFPPPTSNTVPPVPPGSGNTHPQNAPQSNSYKPQNINNNPAWMNTYDRPYSVQFDVDSKNINFIEEDVNNKIRLYVYTAHLLATP